MNNKKSVGRIDEVRVSFSVGINYMDAHKYLQEVAKETGAFRAVGAFNGVGINSRMTLSELEEALHIKEEPKVEPPNESESTILKEHDFKPNLHGEALIDYFKQMARGIIPDDKLDDWDEIVPIRISDLYGGMELGATLRLVKLLDINNCTLDEAKTEFTNQAHSGCSAGLMFAMMREFCKRGNEFVEYVK